jgi:hypothetical protein
VRKTCVVNDEIEFRRVLAESYPFGGRGFRDAIDIYVNGASLSRRLGAAPFDVDYVFADGLATRWATDGECVPIFNCLCGDVDCGGSYVNVVARSDRIEWRPAWRAPHRTYVFDADEFNSSLGAALGDG